MGSLHLSEEGWRTFGIALASGDDPVRMFEGAWQITWREGFEFANPERDDVTAEVKVAAAGVFELPNEVVRMSIPPFLLRRMGGIEQVEQAVTTVNRLNFDEALMYREDYRAFLEMGPFGNEQGREVLCILRAAVNARPGVPQISNETMWRVIRREVGRGAAYIDHLYRLVRTHNPKGNRDRGELSNGGGSTIRGAYRTGRAARARAGLASTGGSIGQIEYNSLQLGEMATEEEINNRKSEGEPDLGGSAAQSEGGQKDRESINPDGTKRNRKEISTEESSGKAGGSKQGTQGAKEGRRKDRTSPRNSEGAMPKKVRVTDTRRRLAEIDKRTAEYKAKLIEEMITGNEEGPLQEEPRDERKANQGGTGQGDKGSDRGGTPSKRRKERENSPGMEAEKATTPPAMESRASRLPITPAVARGCEGLWSLRERVLGWFNPEGTMKTREGQKTDKESPDNSVAGEASSSRGGLKKIVSSLARALNKNQGYLAYAKKKLTFDGANITEFLIDYENLVALVKWTEEEKMDHLGQHVSLSLGRDRMAIVVASRSWKETRDVMMRKYLAAEKMATEADLAAVQRKNFATYNDFLRELLCTITDLAEKTVVTETLALLKEGEIIDLIGRTGNKVKKGIESLHERVHGFDNKIERMEGALLVMQAQVSRHALPPQEAVVPPGVANRGFRQRDPANEQCKYCTAIGHYVRACGMRRAIIMLNGLEITAVEAEPVGEIIWDQLQGRGAQANFILESDGRDRVNATTRLGTAGRKINHDTIMEEVVGSSEPQAEPEAEEPEKVYEKLREEEPADKVTAAKKKFRYQIPILTLPELDDTISKLLGTMVSGSGNQRMTVMEEMYHDIILGRPWCTNIEMIGMHLHDGSYMVDIEDPVIGPGELLRLLGTGGDPPKGKLATWSPSFEDSTRKGVFARKEGMRERVEIMIEEAFNKKEWIKMGLPQKKRRQEDEVLGVMVAEKESEVELGASLPKRKEVRIDVPEIALEIPDLLQLIKALRYHKVGVDSAALAKFEREVQKGYCLNGKLDIKDLLRRFLVYNIMASGPRNILAVPEVTLRGFRCGAYGRKPDPAKTDKISQWPTSLRTTTEVRAFLGVVGFWRIFIKNFAKIAEPIRAMIREKGTMDWTEEREGAVQRLKDILTSETVALSAPCFNDEVGRPFILETDGEPLVVGGVLIQRDERGKERPIRFESRTLNSTERRYSQFKKEVLAILHCLKTFQAYLFRRRFISRIDPTNVAGALKNHRSIDPTVGRWVGFVWQFDYKIERIAGIRNKADGLSRVCITPEGMEDAEPIDAFHEYEGGTLAVDNEMMSEGCTSGELLIQTLEKGVPAEGKDGGKEGEEFFYVQSYERFFREIGLLLVGNKQPTEIGIKAREEAERYVLRGGHLFRSEEGAMPRRVVCERSRQVDVIQAMHNGLAGGHRSSKGTLAKITPLYYWPGMADMVAIYCQTCLICQERSSVRVFEPLRPTRVLGPGHLVHLDLAVMLVSTDGYRYILDARDNLSGFVEPVALKKKTGRNVADWIEDFYLRHPFVRRFIPDNGTKFVNQEVLGMLKRLCVPIKLIEPYHPEANAPVERGHRTLKNTIAKLAADHLGNWPRYLKQAVFAENMTPKRTTGCIPTEL
ncbi:hypothetical protein CBR_g4574 [Chara braunii]|uniref:Integrase catalytic domain-containing protein n=1 Tax=Chara braunii TaxID=69332 RepID=A0A388KIF2_CHABU|nr:hypothetical protein CBR_g4574 [Chara braunii]|eukprot:GBG69743.1 hypothetical protein CBR_g4574 [Chara braunii]